MTKTKARPKLQKFDGFGAAERKMCRSAIRLVWQRSRARQLALKRAMDEDGYYVCEQCGERAPKVHVDHVHPCGEVESNGYIARMFVASGELEVQCLNCHRGKTKQERAAKKARRKG